MTTEEIKELDKKIIELKNFFRGYMCDGSINDLEKHFKKHFNKGIIQVGDKLTFDFNTLFFIDPGMKKEFKNDPIQPITITYLRSDIIFYTYDKNPDKEYYVIWGSEWMRWLYPKEIKQSILFKNKEYLLKTNPNEYYLQVNLFDVSNKYVNYIKDINWL